MAVRDGRGDVRQTTTGFRGPLMVQSLTSAKSKFLSLNLNLGRTLVLSRKLGNCMIFNGIHLFSRNEDFGETHQKSHFLLILAI